MPSHYAVALAPDLEAASFTGDVTVEVDIGASVDHIVMNAIELEIHAATVSQADTTQDATWTLDPELERLTLAVDGLQPGTATVTISFTGTINDKLRGFYRSTFTDDSGETHTIATTQFESTNARRAFPCWDEPDFKATFTVALTHDAALLAISSGPETSRRELGDGRVETAFGTTMVMSTYLLAFVVGPLEATDAVDVDGVPLRVVHPLGKGHLAGFALEAGAFALRHFSEYFAIPYPGEKLDLVGLPDFAFGAMENLGCVTFREALLLLDEATTTQPEQQRVADVINHEIAHMWFGDLVTMSWWNGIWLKEAFATFCEMHCTDAWRPDWKRWDDFGLSRTAAFDTDSLAATRPIEFEVVSPEDAEAMYDVLTYEKGAAVVRMLEQYLGEEPFRDGIRAYLAAHAYGNTETHDLWDAIESSTGQPARQIMDSWIFQGGYPLVDVELTSPTSVRLRQQRFGYDDVAAQQWSVPVVLGVGSDGARRRVPALLDSDIVDVDLGAPADWVVGNADASGFYRVRPDADIAAMVLANLDQLSAVERYGFIDDAWALVLADQLPATRGLELLEALAATEDDLAVWRRITGVLSTVDHHLDGDARAAFRSHWLAVINAALDRTGRTLMGGEADHDTERRAVLFGTAGRFGAPEAIALARELLDAPEDAARTAAAIRIVAEHGSTDDFDEFVRRYDSEDTPQGQRRYMFALAAFPGEREAAAVLDLVDTGRIRSQDGAFVLARALANNNAAATTWAFIEANWDSLNERFPDNAIARMIDGCTSIGDPDVAAAVDRFFESHEVPQAGQTLFQHLERMRVSVALRARLRTTLG